MIKSQKNYVECFLKPFFIKNYSGLPNPKFTFHNKVFVIFRKFYRYTFQELEIIQNEKICLLHYKNFPQFLDGQTVHFFGAAIEGQQSFQIGASPIMHGIISLHHFIVIFLFFIIGFVGFILGWILSTHHVKDLPYHAEDIYFYLINRGYYFDYLIYFFKLPKNENFLNKLVFVDFSSNFYLIKLHTFGKKFTHWTDLEVIWTLIPSLILIIIAYPSFLVLYTLDESVYDPFLTLKVIGHQWFWEYEIWKLPIAIHEINNTVPLLYKIESYMISDNDLVKGDLRLLETDNALFLPSRINIRVLVTSVDVLHSWAIPSLGAKIDACPGRLNQFFLYILNNGVYYGQCSEICGINHAFMPIKIVALSFFEWVKYYYIKIFEGF